MKIENSSVSPLSSRPTEPTRGAGNSESMKSLRSTGSGQDRVEMSEDARLLARARAALGEMQDVDEDKITALREKIESGDYTIQVTELARKLAVKLYPK